MATETKRGNYSVACTAGTTVVNAGPCRLVRAIITTPNTTASDAFDNASAASGKEIWGVSANPAKGTCYEIDCPCDNGITISVGTAGVINVIYSLHK